MKTKSAKPGKKTYRKKNDNTARGPVKIGAILPQVFARYGYHRQLEHDALVEAWTEAVAEFLPDSLKNSTHPGVVKRGVLEVRLEHTALVQELSFHETIIVEKLKEKMPDHKIRRIKYIIMSLK